jgi:COX assembly mitochondrial protein 1
MECARYLTISMPWVCRVQKREMKACLKAHVGIEEEDRAREEWFATREERSRKREEEKVELQRRREEFARLILAEEVRRRNP